MNRGAWQTTVHGVAKSQTRLRDLKKKVKIGNTILCSYKDRQWPLTANPRLLSHFTYWTIFFLFMATPDGLWDLSSSTRDQTCALCREGMES